MSTTSITIEPLPDSVVYNAAWVEDEDDADDDPPNMSDVGTVTAAVKVGDDRWMLTADVQRIANADMQDLIFVETMDELRLALDQRYPAPDTRLSYIEDLNGYGNTCVVSRTLRYEDLDMNAAKEFARQYGAVIVNSTTGRAIGGDNTQNEFLVEGYNDYRWNKLIYNAPARRRRLIRARQKAKLSQVTLEDLRRAYWAFTSTLAPFMNWPLFGGVWTRSIAASKTLDIIRVFDAMFGRYKHRQVGQYQELVRKWKGNLAHNNKVYAKLLLGGGNFCEFMNRAAKARMPAAHTGHFVLRPAITAITAKLSRDSDNAALEEEAAYAATAAAM